MDINIIKCHGTGNDFVLIDELTNDYNINESDRAKMAIVLCDRKGLVGADGILFVQKSLNYDAKMRIFNSDGSEAEMCGNGLRCVGRYAMEILTMDALNIETMKANYIVKKTKSIYKDIQTVEIEINTVNFNAKSLPINVSSSEFIFNKISELSDHLEFTALSITNPHIVTIVDEFDNNSILDIGRRANTLKNIFANGVNVNFVKILDGNSIYVKTYERGVGLTKSCGTGMTASSIVACLKDEMFYNSELNVYNDGGMIKCVVEKSSEEKYKVRFIGNATFIYKASIDMQSILNNEIVSFSQELFENEIAQYDEFLSYVQSITNQ
jgi:diaminopimelate epimerase